MTETRQCGRKGVYSAWWEGLHDAAFSWSMAVERNGRSENPNQTLRQCGSCWTRDPLSCEGRGFFSWVSVFFSLDLSKLAISETSGLSLIVADLQISRQVWILGALRNKVQHDYVVIHVPMPNKLCGSRWLWISADLAIHHLPLPTHAAAFFCSAQWFDCCLPSYPTHTRARGHCTQWTGCSRQWNQSRRPNPAFT